LASQIDALQKAFSGKTVQQQQFRTEPTGGADTLNLTAQLQIEYNSANGRLDKDWIKTAHADHGASKDTINLGKNFTGGVGRLAFLCSVHPQCVAFNSNGWLKSNATITRSGPTVPSDFYVRRSGD
jgi:hypothetical protein